VHAVADTVALMPCNPAIGGTAKGISFARSTRSAG
jgi:tRNA U34 5-carboxymethylaminomethyl modifying enzyme MnmG/GidA